MNTKHILKKSIITGYFVALTFLSCNAAFADNRMPQGRWWENPKIATELQLTEKQKQELDTVFKKQRLEMLEMRSNQEKAQYKLEDILEANNLDKNAAKAEFRKLSEIKAQFAEKRFDFLLEIRQILGADKFRQLKNTARERMPKRFGAKDNFNDEPGATGKR